jgi:hypothetical protein
MRLALVLWAALLVAAPALAQTSNPTCGLLNDNRVLTPEAYDSFKPPAAGQYYTDPLSHCKIWRLTDVGLKGSKSGIHHNYSTQRAMNADDTMVIVQQENVTPAWWIISFPHGMPAVDRVHMPQPNSPNIVWDVNNAKVFWETQGNRLVNFTIRGTNSIAPAAGSVKHVFTGFASVIIPDQTDWSDDGCKIWLIGFNGGTGTAILYNACTDAVVSQSLNVGKYDGGCQNWHKLQTFPDGKLLITWSGAGAMPGCGEEVYNTDGTLNWHVGDSDDHSEVGINPANGHVIMAYEPYNNPNYNLCPDRWASLTIFDVTKKVVDHCLITGIPSWHVSYRDSPIGWFAISTFSQGKCPNSACFELTADWNTGWLKYAEEILLVSIDGKRIYRMGHTRSRSAGSYWSQPHASLSADARYVVFTSNYGISDTGWGEYTDVYVLETGIGSH